jgi:hypothetical protein
MRSRLNVPDVDPTYVGEDWRLGITAIVKRDINNIRSLIEEYEKTSLTFKSSSKKSDVTLRYIPINLHLHVFKMNGIPPLASSRVSETSNSSLATFAVEPVPTSFTCDFMTVGAFAAHSMKFKSGGLWHMMKMFDERLAKQTRGLVPVLKNDFRLPDEVISFHNQFTISGMESCFTHPVATRSKNILYGV